MYNCIYSGHCTQMMCDKSCPTLAETSYLLERNNLPMSSQVFNMKDKHINRCLHILSVSEGKICSEIVNTSDTREDNIWAGQSTVSVADMIAYCGICQRWKGSRLHCTVYNLRFSTYVESIRNSWGGKGESEELEYMKIWSTSAKLLIISGLDYVNFRDFECQTLLTLLQTRSRSEYTTIIVSPLPSTLVGNSNFFGKLTQLLNSSKVSTDSKVVTTK